ncbi:MAG: hypothetical protein OXE56_04645 [Gammaproteobacteria bacterium]|nr:hypothetical protein [Gammaproteobacteria bacterium]
MTDNWYRNPKGLLWEGGFYPEHSEVVTALAYRTVDFGDNRHASIATQALIFLVLDMESPA